MRQSKFPDTQIVAILKAADVKWLKELEHELRRLKRMYAELSLENQGLQGRHHKKALPLAERRALAPIPGLGLRSMGGHLVAATDHTSRSPTTGAPSARRSPAHCAVPSPPRAGRR